MSNTSDIAIKNGVLVEWRSFDREIEIPNTVKVIGENAIPKGVETVIIPDSVVEIGESAFLGCYALQSIVIPKSVTKIGRQAFFRCENLRSVTIENSDVEIGESAFTNCKKLADANGFVIVNNILFDYFGHETDVEVPQGVTYINMYAFVNGNTIKTITLPDSVTRIGDYAFACAPILQSVTMGDNLQEAGKDLFDYRAKVTLNAPSGSYAERIAKERGLSFVPNGQGNTINNAKSDFVIKDGVLIEYKGHAEHVVIPDEVVEIGDRAFMDNGSIRKVEIPDSVKKIGWAAFARCWGLESVELPESLTHISGLAFQHCNKLANVALPNKIVAIGARIFEGCKSLTGEIVVPDSVTKIELNAFASCSNLESVTIGDGVKYIGEEAFKQCSKLKRISFPESVELICKKAFYGCISLEKITFSSESQATIDAEVFAFCPHLKEVNIPNGLQIKESTFSGATMLKNSEGFYLSKDKRCIAIAQHIPIRTPEEYAYAWLYQSGKAWQEYLRKTTIDAEQTLAVMADLLCADKKVKSATQKNLVAFLDNKKGSISNAAKQRFLEQLSTTHDAVTKQLN